MFVSDVMQNVESGLSECLPVQPFSVTVVDESVVKHSVYFMDPESNVGMEETSQNPLHYTAFTSLHSVHRETAGF